MFSAFHHSGYAMVTRTATVDRMKKTVIQMAEGTTAAMTKNVAKDFSAITLRLTQNLGATSLEDPMHREDRSRGKSASKLGIIFVVGPLLAKGGF